MNIAAACSFIIEKIKAKLNIYKANRLSHVARNTLLKFISASLLVYYMSNILFPKKFLSKLTSIIRNFWWGGENESRKIQWLAWDKLLKPKGKGGMGFWDLRLFNQAILATQAWRLIQFPDSLCARLLKAKYYPHGNLADTAFIQNASPC